GRRCPTGICRNDGWPRKRAFPSPACGRRCPSHSRGADEGVPATNRPHPPRFHRGTLSRKREREKGWCHRMTGPFRLASGGRVDRGKVLRFSFDGSPYAGLTGDTLASALLANGVHLVGRSFKYHRPRGILSAGSDEPNALVGIGASGRYTPNLRATQAELYE